MEVLQACEAACGTWSSCGFRHVCPTCTALNVSYNVDHDEACIAAALAEYECEEVQSCASLAFFNESPFDHPNCGTAAAEFQATCGYAASPPEECVAYCARAAECDPSVGQGACTYSCNLELEALLRDDPPECHQRLLDHYACYATLDCAPLLDWLVAQEPAAACNTPVDEMSETSCP